MHVSVSARTPVHHAADRFAAYGNRETAGTHFSVDRSQRIAQHAKHVSRKAPKGGTAPSNPFPLAPQP